MPNLPYKTSGWDTHSEVKLREIDFPLFEQEPDHFTVLRTYEGPEETYVKVPLNTLDVTFDGVAKSVTGTASTDELVAGANHNLQTGDPVTLAITSGLAGLTTATVYYVIRIGSTAVKLATTQANAVAGTAINITSDGTGTLTAAAAYLVRQSPKRDVDGGCVRYDRTFATIPAPWSEPEEYAFEFPGYLASAIGASQSISAITASGSNYVISTALTGVSAGDSVYISVKYTRNGHVYNTSFFTKAVAASSGVSVTVANIFGGTGSFSSITGTIRTGAPGRGEAESLIVGSRLLHEYALSTALTVNSDLPLLDKFTAIDSSGLKVSVLSSGTATVPNSVDYASLIVNNGELVADSSLRRYLGNIFCRTTRYVPAR